ncbi:MAG: prolyl oligopeptidase family serine peptidase, partial [Oscillospiraceae bacterium]|nr:prolyl oligopeptidase family serine peptidase [Oscillospiraceae bacterium]
YRPTINIIFATAYSNYYQQAMRIHASGYMLKPIRAEVLLEELNDLRHPVQRGDDLLHVRTFGDFEVFYHDQPLIFRYQKTKEMLAYLIDRRGAMVESDTLITILWGGETDRSNYFKQIRKDLKDTLEEIGCGDVLIKRRGAIGLFGCYDLHLQSQFSAAHPMASTGQPVMFVDKFVGAETLNNPNVLYFSNPSNFVTRNCPPMFIQCGDKDQVVPYEGSIQLAERINAVCGEGRAELTVFHDALHGDPQYETPENIDRIFAFIEKNK